MDTNEQIVARAVDGNAIVASLNGVPGLRARLAGVYDTEDPVVMNEAITLLRRSGYNPSEIRMIEGDFYVIMFLPDYAIYRSVEHWPYWFKLRFLTDGFSAVSLALASRTETGFDRYTGSYPQTAGTGTSDAEKMLLHFRHDRPDDDPVWVPIFGGMPTLF